MAAPNDRGNPLMETVILEVSSAIRDDPWWNYPFTVRQTVDTLFRLLTHRLDDAALADAGQQCLAALSQGAEGTLGNLADRCEAFAKMLLQLVDPAKFAEMNLEKKGHPTLSHVVFALGLATGKVLGAETLADLRGQPRCAEHVGRVILTRNAVHNAPRYTFEEKGAIFKSVCVFLVFAAAEYREQIERALLVERERTTLERLRKQFGKWAPRYVDIHGSETATEDFAGVDPLAMELFEDADGEAGAVMDELADGIPRPGRIGRVIDLIEEVPHAIFLGEPGAGKTTTPQYLAWRLIDVLLENRAEASTFPVYIALNRCGPEPGNSLPEPVTRAMSAATPEELAMAEAHPVLLLDGLNEVRVSYLDAVIRDLRELMQRDHLRVAVTSRPGMYRGQLLCPAFELQRLTDAQMEELLRKHFPSADRAANFAAVLYRHPKLWEWGRNPLMLAMLARVGLRQQGVLPENRGRLMEAFISDLLRREEYQKHQAFDESLKIRLLAGLAFETRAVGRVVFSYALACQILRDVAAGLGSSADIPGLVAEVGDNNLLVSNGEGMLGFAHEMYQEYFAAVQIEIRSRADAAFPLTLQANPFWEEPLVLFSGISTGREEFIQAVSTQNPLIAARSLMSAVGVDEGLHREVSAVARRQATELPNTDPEKAARSLVALVELGSFDELTAALGQAAEPKAGWVRAIHSAVQQASPDQVLALLIALARLRDSALFFRAADIAVQRGSLCVDSDAIAEAKNLLEWILASNADKLRIVLDLYMVFGLADRLLAERLLRSIDAGFEIALQAACRSGYVSFDISMKKARQLACNLNLQTLFKPEEQAWAFYEQHKLVGFHTVLEVCSEANLTEMVRGLAVAADVGLRAFALAVVWARGLHGTVDTATLTRSILDTPLTAGRVQRLTRLLARHGQLETYAGTLHPLIKNLMAADAGCQEYFRSTMPQEMQALDSLCLHQPPVDQKASVNKRGAALFLTAKADRTEETAWRHELFASLFSGKIVRGTVRSILNGGFAVDIGLTAWCPSDQIDTTVLKALKQLDLNQFVGNTYDFKIVKLNADRGAVVLSRRKLIKAERATKLHAFLESVSIGDLVMGTVKNLVDFGAFIDLGGVDGLLHVKNMARSRRMHPRKMFNLGDRVLVRVLEINKEKERVSLGSKRLRNNDQTRQNDPWDKIEMRYPIGKRIRGYVYNMTAYGAFVEIEEGIDGMIHVSDMSWTRRINLPDEVLSKGEEVDAVVINVDEQNRRIRLSIKQLEGDPWKDILQRYKVGMVVKGVVKKIMAHGALVELERELNGLLHISKVDDGCTHQVGKFPEAGQEVEVSVIKINEAKRYIYLSMRTGPV